MTPLATSLIPALSGQHLGPYRLNGCLGGGGFGLVFHACNATTGAEVAVKLLMPSPDPHAAAEFDAEGVLLRKLNRCEGVVTLVDSGTGDIPMTTSNGLVVPLPFKYLVLSLASGALNELTRDPSARPAMSAASPARLSDNGARPRLLATQAGDVELSTARAQHRLQSVSVAVVVAGGSARTASIGDLNFDVAVVLPLVVLLAHDRAESRMTAPRSGKMPHERVPPVALCLAANGSSPAQSCLSGAVTFPCWKRATIPSFGLFPSASRGVRSYCRPARFALPTRAARYPSDGA